MKKLTESKIVVDGENHLEGHLENEERNLLSVAYKNVVGATVFLASSF